MASDDDRPPEEVPRDDRPSGEPPASARDRSAALVGGWRLLWRSKRLWAFLWLLHLALGAVMAGAFAGVWDGILGRRLAAGRLGGPETAGVLVDLVNHHGQALSRVLRPVGLSGIGGAGSPLIVLGWAWLGAVLAGGVLAWLVRVSPDRRPDLPAGLDGRRVVGPPFLAAFLWDCGSHLGRMSRLLLLHLLVLWLSLLVVVPLAGSLLVAPLGPAPAPDAETRVGLAVLAVAAVVFLFLGLVHDYARVRVVREQRRSVVIAWWKGLRFVFRRFLRVVGLQGAFLAIVVAVAAGWWLWGPGTDAGLVTLALAPALWLLVRAGLRIWWLGSELALFDRRV